MFSVNCRSSICKKGLILNSGSPVILPLYPGDCNHPSEVISNIFTLEILSY